MKKSSRRMHDLSGVNFTIHADEKINRAIAFQLCTITEAIRELLGDELKAVLIAGGFGRGEGGVCLEGEQVRPINDYDFYIVVNNAKTIRRRFGEKLDRLAREYAERFALKQIDLGIVNAWQLWIPRRSVVRYEARWGHKIVYGPDRVFIAAFPARFLSLNEGTQYFFTRGAGLLIARYLLDHADLVSDMPWEENFMIEINKAWIAMGDALLISLREYHWSYQERLRRFLKAKETISFPHKEQIARWYEVGVNKKLSGDFRRPPALDPEERWRITTTVFLELFLYFESKRLRKTFSSVEEYDRYFQRKLNAWRSDFFEELRAFLSRGRRKSRMSQAPTVFRLLNGFLDLREKKDGSVSREALTREVERLLYSWHPEGMVGELLKRVAKKQAEESGTE